MEKAKPKMIARKKDVELKPARSGGRRLEVVSPRLGFPVRTMLTFYREIPPGGQSGTHRHRNEAIIYIVKGRGYTLVEDERVDQPPAHGGDGSLLHRGQGKNRV